MKHQSPIPLGAIGRLSPKQQELLLGLANAEGRENFWAFRQLIDPSLIRGWFQRSVASALQRFWVRYQLGLRPKLALAAPPQHGKSRQVREFLAWIAGHDPDLRQMFTSYSDDLGVANNLAMQRVIMGPNYGRLFPDTKLANESSQYPGAGKYLRNTSIFEFPGWKGSFRNTTVMGQITGQGLDIGVIDDPIKGRAEANSKVIRDKVWNWLTDDFFSRFSDKAGMIFIMTRWHIDDPMGRFIEHFPETEVIRYPALALSDELFRHEGEPLFPEFKSLPYLLERKKALSQGSWEALFQQNPIIVGGNVFPIEKLTIHPIMDRSQIMHSVRYWDKAGTEDGGAFTAGVLMHKLLNGTFLIEHVARGQWSALEREQRIKQWTMQDASQCPSYEVWMEQEPGSGGKESAENTIRMLSGYNVHADKVTGSKEIRADPYAAQVQGGNVRLVAGLWVPPFLDEHEAFPNWKYKDQVDAAAGAFAQLALKDNYDHSYRGWAS